jgi:hypothetical protein
MNQLLQKYNVEEDLTDPAPPRLSPLLSRSYLVTTRQVELELEDLEGPLLFYLMKP